MMAWRTHQRIGIVDAAAQHRRHRHPGAAGRQQGDLVAAAPDRRLRPGIDASDLAEFLDVLDVAAGVDAGQILGGDRLGLDAHQMAGEAADVQQPV